MNIFTAGIVIGLLGLAAWSVLVFRLGRAFEALLMEGESKDSEETPDYYGAGKVGAATGGDASEFTRIKRVRGEDSG